MSESREVPFFVCPNVKDTIDSVIFTHQNTSYYSSDFPPKSKFIFSSQSGLRVFDQIAHVFDVANVSYVTLDIDERDHVTIPQLENLKITPDDIVIIKNAHLMLYVSKSKIIKDFAHNIKHLENTVIAISDVPIDSSMEFYSQFEEITVARTPTQSHLNLVFEYNFEKMSMHFQEQNINVGIELTNEDYLWLAQNSSDCHEKDVRAFILNVFHHAMTRFRLEQSFVITREFIEDVNNKIMFKKSSDEPLSITERDPTAAQNAYLARGNKSVNPRKRSRN